MNAEDQAKVMHVWESENRILDPAKKAFRLEIIDQIASLFSAGDFYYYVLNFESLQLDLVRGGIQEVLGIAPDQFTLQSGFELMHPDDLAHLYEKEAVSIDFLYNRISPEEILSYKVAYLLRMRHVSGQYNTLLHQAIALSLTDNGKIHYTLGIHTDVSHLNIPFNHNVSFKGYQKPSFYATYNRGVYTLGENTFKTLFTKREIEILHHISLGRKFNEIADRLYVSPHTVNTHKKNILLKSGCKSMSEVIARCIREGVI